MTKSKIALLINSIIILLSAVCCCFCFASKPIKEVEAASGSWADYTNSSISGNGTSSDPYIIDSAAKFAYISYAINNGISNFNTANYIQVTDIDLSDHYWKPMNTFAGVYDGYGFKITGITGESSVSNFGLVSSLSGTWKNSGLSVSIDNSANYDYSVATLAVNTTSSSIIDRCYVSGSIYVSTTGILKSNYVAGLVVNHYGTIKNCYSIATLTATSKYLGNSGEIRTAGIATNIFAGALIENCYFAGNAKVQYGYWKVGGIVGKPVGGTINNCAVLTGTCNQAGNIKNSFINQQRDSIDATVTNCLVVEASALQSNSSAPLSSWDFSDNTTDRYWGYPSSNSEYYNSGYPALRNHYESFTVSFYSEDGGTLLRSQTTGYPYYSVQYPEAQSKRGYTFNGWSRSSNSTGTVSGYGGTLSNVFQSANFYAHFTINNYNLSVSINIPSAATMLIDGTPYTTYSQDLTYATTHTLTLSDIRTDLGYEFVGWVNTSTDEVVSTNASYSVTISDSPLSLEARFRAVPFTVKVYVNNYSYGSTSFSNQDFYPNEVVTVNATANPGYKFDGFYATRTRVDGEYQYSDLLSNTLSHTFSMPVGVVEIYAVFSPKPLTLTVMTYDGQLDSSSQPLYQDMSEITISPIATNYYIGDEITLSVATNEDGEIVFNSTTYIFTRWKLNDYSKDEADGVDPTSFTFTMPAYDTTVYACFISTNSYFAFVDKNNNVVSDGLVPNTATLTPPTINSVELKNHVFDGWYNKDMNNCYIQVADGAYTNSYTLNGVTERIVLYAKYTKIFSCEISLQLNINNHNYLTNPNSPVFVALIAPNNQIFSVSLIHSKTINFTLFDKTLIGEWKASIIAPTHHTASLYFDKTLSTTFNISNNDDYHEILIQLSKEDDKLLHDHTLQPTLDIPTTVPHYSTIDGDIIYTGLNKELEELTFSSLQSRPVSPYGYEIKDIIGATNWGPLYSLTSDPILEEGANITAKDLGSTVHKVSFSNDFAQMYKLNSDWSDQTVHTLTDLLYTKYFNTLFHRSDIETFILVAYEIDQCPWYQFAIDGLKPTQLQPFLDAVVDEFAELTDNLMLDFRNENKTFILSNWEADNSFGLYCYDVIESMRGSLGDVETDRRLQLCIDFFTAYINARQDGIIKGREKFASRGISSSTIVYGNFEVNAATESVPWMPTRPRAYSAIIPNTYCDLYSISDWYSIQTETGNNTQINWDASPDAYTMTMFLNNIWTYVQQNRTFLDQSDPNYKPCIWDFGEDLSNPIKNIMVTEFGSDENNENQRNLQHVQTVTNEAIAWGAYKVVFWQIYSNALYSDATVFGTRPRNEDCQGLWLIRPDGTITDSFWYLKGIIDGTDYLSNKPTLIFSTNYADTYGLDWSKYSNDIIFKDDLTDTSKMLSYSKFYDSALADNSDSRLNFVDASVNQEYFNKYTGYFGLDYSGVGRYSQEYVDNGSTGTVNLAGTSTQITYSALSNRFGFLMYNYSNLSDYSDYVTGAMFENQIVYLLGKNKFGEWEKIENVNYTQTLASGNSVWYQTYASVVLPQNTYSEIKIVFNNELNYNIWDPIITSVFFFK